MREAIAFRLARAQHLTDRGQFAEAIAMLERKLAARPRDPDLYFALARRITCAAHSGDAVKIWTRGAEVQAELAHEAGLSTNTRYLGTMFTRMIGHTAYFDTFAKRKLLGLAPEKYIVLADRTNIGNAAYVECWRDHFEIIDDPESDSRECRLNQIAGGLSDGAIGRWKVAFHSRCGRRGEISLA